MSKEELRYIRKIWRAIKYRTSPNYFESHLYYDKGVKVCDLWINNYSTFESWAIENGLRKGLCIDRIDGNDDYCPENCRVITQMENSNNRVDTYYVNYNGVEYAFCLLLREKGLYDNMGAIRGRIKRGWSIEKAIDTPIRKGNYQNRWK